CLQDFRSQPFVECQGSRGTCQYSPTFFSFWLTRVNEQNFDAIPYDTDLNGQNQQDSVSTCTVCIKDIQPESLMFFKRKNGLRTDIT
ncbi:hypothetical protein M9458_030804, partial [Cirrhinus mrigala]